MRQAIGGTVTFLFTDLVRSTELLESLGDDEYESVRRSHVDLLRRAVLRQRGQVVKTEGDGMMASFAGAVDALACAAEIQQAMHRENEAREAARTLSVRAGLHVGEPIVDGKDYQGMPVVIARRLCDRAQGGQIIASDLLRKLVGSRGGLAFRELGGLELKGISAPVPACEVLWQPSADEPSASQAASLAGERLPPPAPLMARERTSFVARRSELEALTRLWERARAGEPQLVMLSGQSGVGKTRLAAELAWAAHADGANVLFGRSHEDVPLPSQPFLDSLRPFEDATGYGLPTAPELAESAQATERVMFVLEEACHAAPTVLVLDDLHCADKDTLALLRYVVRRFADLPLLILGTYCETDIERPAALAETLADLGRDRLFERISLAGLEEPDVAALVRAWAGQDVSPDLARAIYQQTEGNPFYIEEVLRHLTESGVIRVEGGQLVAGPAVDLLAIPESVRDVIARRLSRLSDQCNSVLAIASVIGQQFDLESLERASDLSGEHLAELLEEAVRARLIDEIPQAEGRYVFPHTLVHDALYDELTTTRRVRLHGQTLRYADSNGAKLAYEVLGASGPYLVAVGLTNCPAVRGRNRAFTRRWEPIMRYCRVVLYDRRGVGFSSAPPRGYGVVASIEDLRAVLDAVGAERVVLWGTTDGGPLATAFAVRYPERVIGLLLLGTTPKLINSDDFKWGIRSEAIASFTRTDSIDRVAAVTQITRTRHADERAQGIGEALRRIPQHAWAKITGAIGEADVRDLLARVTAPTLIVQDPDNAYIPAEASRYLHERIPDSRLMITEDYGRPVFGEGLFREIQAFIQQAARGVS